ncbi:MAG: hypothetical protein JWQ31_4217 [Mycobacterium sp.]|jgi:hypothetical protein|nr:hypothetical protein [Mycobacterium sp.]MDT5095984.1 hypothetical protein [Mycobacterium sp.]
MDVLRRATFPDLPDLPDSQNPREALAVACRPALSEDCRLLNGRASTPRAQ